MAKWKRWQVACSREFFTEKNVRNTHICVLHWPGKKGPTDEFPNPLKANLRPAQVSRAHVPKRKTPKERKSSVKETNYLMTTTRNNYLTILQFLMIMIRSHKKLNRQSTKAVLLLKNVLISNVPRSILTFTLTLQESWCLIKALRLCIQNTSCLQR